MALQRCDARGKYRSGTIVVQPLASVVATLAKPVRSRCDRGGERRRGDSESFVRGFRRRGRSSTKRRVVEASLRSAMDDDMEEAQMDTHGLSRRPRRPG